MSKRWMKSRRTILKISLIVSIIVSVIVVVGIGVVGGNSIVVDVLSFLATIVGTIFIAVELRSSSKTTCSDMLINLNNYFHENEALMSIYNQLDSCYEKGKKLDCSVLDNSAVGAYATFFENLYLLEKNKIARMADIDALFGYRFFIFMNNPSIQEGYILPTSSSYSNLFELYSVWIDYRHTENKYASKKKKVVYEEFCYDQQYLDEKYYLEDIGYESSNVGLFTSKKGIELQIRKLNFSHLQAMMDLQESVVGNMPNKDWLHTMDRNEYIMCLHKNLTLGVFCQDKLVSVVVLVTQANLPKTIKNIINTTGANTAVFDYIVVHREYTGNGLHQYFLQYLIEKMPEFGIEDIVATVHKDNKYSMNNFINNGYKLIKSDVVMYGNYIREILYYNG